MHKDLISYQLADGVTEEHLVKVASRIVKEWMKDLPGFIKWEINTNGDGCYTDVVYWENAASAKAAEEKMKNIPNGVEWYSCYKPGTISGKHLSKVAEF